MKWSITYITILLVVFFQTNTVWGQKQLDQQQLEENNRLAKKYLEQGDSALATNYINKLAFIYMSAGMPEYAIENFKESAAINQKLRNYEDLKIIYGNIGMLYADMLKLHNSLEYFEKSLAVRRQIGKPAEIVAGLIDVSNILINMRNYREAHKRLTEALEKAQRVDDPELLKICYLMLAKIAHYLNEMDQYQSYMTKYQYYNEVVQQKTQEKREAQSELEVSAAEQREAMAKATLAEKQLALLRKTTSLEAEKLKTKIQDEEIRRQKEERQKQEVANKLLKQEQALQDLEIERQTVQQEKNRTRLIAMVVLIALMFLLGLVVLSGYRNKRKANRLLEKQNEEIIEQRDNIEAKNIELNTAFGTIQEQNENIQKSINYAERIQRAMLPDIDNLKEFLPSSFILFKPRDVVSGDFYWFTEAMCELPAEMPNSSDKMLVNTNFYHNKFIISAVDCTGHGVPGAFMSMIGFNLLDEIVNKGVTHANQILYELHKGIRKALKQDITSNRDGMDMSICVIDNITQTVEFAGAQNPLVYITDDEVKHIRGDKKGIGGRQGENERERTFKNHLIKVDKPTWFYLFSDGYADQFGGDRGRKFMSKRFRQMLFDNHKKEMTKQQEVLDQTITDWIGDFRQVDDMLVIGFHLGGDFVKEEATDTQKDGHTANEETKKELNKENVDT